MMATLSSAIRNLFRWLVYALTILLQFLIIIALGILVAITYALPWLLRVGAFIVWLFGAYLLTRAVGEVYSPFSEAIPVMALQLFVVAIQLVMVMAVLMTNSQLIWGGLYFSGGIPIWLALKGIPDAFIHWQHADFFFRVLPPALWAVMLLYLTVKAKVQKSGKKFLPSLTVKIPMDTIIEKVGRATHLPTVDFGTKPFGFEGNDVEEKER